MNDNGIKLLSTLLGEEPVGVLLLAVTAILLFGSFFTAAREKSPWSRNLYTSAVRSMIFIGIVLGGYVFAKSNIGSFNTIYQSFTSQDSISWFKWKRAAKTWGGWINQNELRVAHFIETESQATLPVVDPAAPILYQTYIMRQQIPQNSIVRFRGRVDLISGKDEDLDGFNGFYAHSTFTYDVINQSDSTVQTEFLFPLHSYQTTYQDIHVRVDEKEIASLVAAADGLHWSMELAPRQKVIVFVSYSAKGMEGYTYALTDSREITDFILTISANDRHVYASMYPTGETIRHEAYVISGNMHISTVRIDRAVAAPAMGVNFVQTSLPYAPYDSTLRLLRFFPRASIFLAIVLVLTLLISGASFGLRELILFQSVFWAHTLVYMLAGLWLEDPRHALLCSAISLTVLQYFILRSMKLTRFAMIALLAWTFFFMGIYLLSGQKADTYPINQYDNLVLAGILIYVFSYTLSKRVAGRPLQYELTKRGKRILLVHWLARIFSIPTAVFYGGLVVYGLIGLRSSKIHNEAFFLLGMFSYFFVSSLLSWKFERIVGIALMVGAVAFGVFVISIDEMIVNDFVMTMAIFASPAVVSGFLFLYGWKLKSSHLSDVDGE